MNLLQRLHELQRRQGWLSEDALRALSAEEGIPLYRLQEVASFYPHFRLTPPPRHTVRVCRDAACHMQGAEALARDLHAAFGSTDGVAVEGASCLGRCEHAPAVTVDDVPIPGADVPQILALAREEEALPGDAPTDHPRPWPSDPYAGDAAAHYCVLSGLLDDREAARKDVPDLLQEAGLKGMGGAGFPTGLKWQLVRDAAGSPKHAIVNADESEPGTFKDRVILEELPHLVLEGLLIGCLVTGAERAVVFVRHEYGRETKAVRREIERARAAGWLERVGVEVEIFVSPGGYILGEETALLEALEGKRGEPRNKPPYPVENGLFGRPTLINNVETFSFVPLILAEGAAAWKAHGTNGAAGWKFFSVCGDVETPDVYCVPLGTTLRDLVDRHAGGMKDGRAMKAFSPGGASAPFLPASKADTPLDFGPMAEAGSMLGSGAVLIVDERRNLLELATNVTRFFRNESCGKCVPCRVGTEKAVQILEGLREKEATGGEAALIEELDETLRLTSICGLGQAALGPALGVLQHFPGEIE